MIRYIIRRVLWAVLVLLIVVFITYMIFFLLPSGDPAVRLAGKNITPRLLDQIRLQFGLDHPWYIQYLLFLKHVFLGDQYGWPGLGLSFTSKVPLKGIIFSRIAVTAQLALGAAIVWLVVGISIGILSALRPRSLEDRTAMGLRRPRHLHARVLARADRAVHLLVQAALAAGHGVLPARSVPGSAPGSAT